MVSACDLTFQQRLSQILIFFVYSFYNVRHVDSGLEWCWLFS